MPDATERKVLAASAFIAALMLFPLGGRITQAKQLLERVSALSALALAALLFAYHLWASRREAEAEVTPPPTTEAAAQPTADGAPPPTTEAAPQPTADAAPQPIAAAQPADAPAPSSNGSRP
jgi:hypothetical protein